MSESAHASLLCIFSHILIYECLCQQPRSTASQVWLGFIIFCVYVCCQICSVSIQFLFQQLCNSHLNAFGVSCIQ